MYQIRHQGRRSCDRCYEVDDVWGPHPECACYCADCLAHGDKIARWVNAFLFVLAALFGGAGLSIILTKLGVW